MDNICAPQWKDFTQDFDTSLADYFDKEHAIHEHAFSYSSSNIIHTPIPSNYKYHLDKVNLGACSMTPVEVILPSTESQKPCIETTTFDDALQESIKNLEISAKRICKTPKVNVMKDNADCPQNSTEQCNSRSVSINQRLDHSSEPKQIFESKSCPRVLTCTDRLTTLTKPRGDKYVSLAEAVSKYQNDTPKRFHSIATKVKPEGSSTQLNHTVSLTKLPKFQSTRGMSSSTSKLKSNTHLQDLDKTKHCLTVDFVPLKNTPNSHTKKLNTKNTVPYIDANNEGEQVALRKEVLYYGVPIITKKKSTIALNFGSSKKQTPKNNVKFASSLSGNSKNTKKTTESGSILKNRVKLPNNILNSQLKGPVRSLDFEGRNNQLLKKKEEHMKKGLEEQNNYVFRARPVPNFKPVLVRGISTENLNFKTKTPGRVKGSIKKNQNKENIDCNVLIDESRPVMDKGKENHIKPISLNSETRAIKRRLFDGQIKQKEMEIWLKHQQEEKARLENEKMEILEMRKKMGTIAKPMPLYKDPKPLRNIKPLTYPQSPAWSRRVIPKKM